MSYTITKSDGSTLATVADGSINATTTSLVLIGKNYAGYGVFLNENYVKLLENFAYSTAPNVPMTGQLWYDTSNKVLKVYDASITQWKPISSSATGGTPPSNPVVGDLWWDSINSQLRVWSGSSWVIIGPVYTATAGTSGALPETILDVSAGSHVVIKFYVSNTVVGIISKDATFTPQTAIAGFSTIRPGFNLVSASSIAGAQFTGDVSSALTLQGLPSAAFLRKDIAETATLPFVAAGGLTVGASTAGLQFDNTSNTEVAVTSLTNNKDIVVNVTRSSAAAQVMRMYGATSNVAFSACVSVSNALTVTGNTSVGAALNVTGVTNLTGQLFANAVSVASTFAVTGAAALSSTLTVTGATQLNSTLAVTGNVTVANLRASTSIVPTVNNTVDLGSNNFRFASVYATSFVGNLSSGGGTISGNVAGTTGTFSGNVSALNGILSGSLTVNSLNLPTAIINGGTAGIGNIGSAGQGFNTIFAKATSAQYADLAERFEADAYYEPGTVVEIGGLKEITRALKELSEAVFGVISTLPGFLMNDKSGSTEMNPPVAMNGRVPVRVIGKIKKGDRLVSAGNGLARAGNRDEITAFNVIGRALEDKDTTEQGLVEAIVKLNS